MLFLLDANVLIDANRDYYPLDRVPEFWAWLAHQGAAGRVKVPIEIFDEVRRGTDNLAGWCRQQDVSSILIFDGDADPATVAHVVATGYAPDLNDLEIEKIGRDPFLVACALAHTGPCCIVTTEVSKPGKQRANRHLPDVARQLGADSCGSFEFLRRLDFRTNWR